MSERKRKQAARKQAQQRRMLFLAAALICVFILGIICGGRMVDASKPVKHNYKYYKELKVGLNDTLWDIADTYMTEDYASVNDYIKEIQEINSLTDDQIVYGQRLLIPYYSHEWK